MHTSHSISIAFDTRRAIRRLPACLPRATTTSLSVGLHIVTRPCGRSLQSHIHVKHARVLSGIQRVPYAALFYRESMRTCSRDSSASGAQRAVDTYSARHCTDMMGFGDGSGQHQLDRMQTICTSLQTDNHTNTSSLIVLLLIDIVLLIDRLHCIDLFSCIAASLFNKLTYLLTQFLQTGCSSRRPTNCVKAPKALTLNDKAGHYKPGSLYTVPWSVGSRFRVWPASQCTVQLAVNHSPQATPTNVTRHSITASFVTALL